MPPLALALLRVTRYVLVQSTSSAKVPVFRPEIRTGLSAPPPLQASRLACATFQVKQVEGRETYLAAPRLLPLHVACSPAHVAGAGAAPARCHCLRSALRRLRRRRRGGGARRRPVGDDFRQVEAVIELGDTQINTLSYETRRKAAATVKNQRNVRPLSNRSQQSQVYIGLLSD